jgi:hypothetical protein
MINKLDVENETTREAKRSKEKQREAKRSKDKRKRKTIVNLI